MLVSKDRLYDFVSSDGAYALDVLTQLKRDCELDRRAPDLKIVEAETRFIVELLQTPSTSRVWKM